MPSITLAGYARETRALVSLARDLVVGQKLFLCRVGRSFAPLDLPVLIPRVKNGLPRGAGVFAPPADLQRSFPLQLAVAAVAGLGVLEKRLGK